MCFKYEKIRMKDFALYWLGAGDVLYRTLEDFNCLPKDKTLDVFKVKGFAGGILNLVEMLVIVCESVENLVGKGENTGYQYFLLFTEGFQRMFLQNR